MGWPNAELVICIADAAIFLLAFIAVLAGLEGFILVRSIFWWLAGFILGTAGTIILGWWSWTGDPHRTPPTAILAALIAAGLLIGILGGRIAVLLSWMFWKVAVFLFGLGLGGILWLGFFHACFPAEDPWILGIGAVLAGLGVGAAWVLAFRAVFPATWLIQNVLQLAGAGIVLAPGGLGKELAAIARQLPPTDLALLAILDAASGIFRDAGMAVLRIPWLLPAALGASVLFVALVMWIQRFPSRFGLFYDRIFSFAPDRYAILELFRSAWKSLAGTLSALSRLTRMAAE